jgi:hypothetical protein
MRLLLARLRPAKSEANYTKSEANYTMSARCPQCGRKHITVFRLRHVSDSLFLQLGHFFRYARHFNFRRLRWCPNSGQHPDWKPS